MKKVLIIGTGPSGISVLENLAKENLKIDIVDGSKNRIMNESKIYEQHNYVSPKYNYNNFEIENKNFVKKNKLSLKNFFLSSTLTKGGGSKFWGSGIEVPKKNYYIKNKLDYKQYEKKIYKSKKFFNIIDNKIINNQISIEQNILKKLVNPDRYFKLEKLNLSIKNKNFNDLPKFFSKSFFNTSNKIQENLNNNINYSKLFVEKITKKKKFLVHFSNKINKEYDYIFCCAGNIGSTIIVSRLLKLSKIKFRIFHNPMFLIIGISLRLMFKKKLELAKSIMEIPSSTIVYNSKNNHKGSLMLLNNIKIERNGFSIKYFIFDILKKYLIGGNFFLDQKFSNSYLYVNKNNYEIVGKNIKFPKKIKMKLYIFLVKNLLLPLPFLNLKRFKTGSDAHYTSSLYEYNKNYKILNPLSELKSFKNFFILDGSVIPPGLNYPTFFQVVNNFVKCEKIKKRFKNAKK